LHTPAAASLRPRHPSSIEPRTSFLPSEYCLTAQTVLPWIFFQSVPDYLVSQGKW